MKHSKYISLAFFGVIFLITSCHKEKRGPWKLSSGNGVWQVESLQWVQYDSLGNETMDSILNNLGELVFMRTDWGTTRTFMGKYVHFDESGDPVSTHPIDYNSDGKKVTLDGTLPVPIAGLYNIDRNGMRTQRWVALTYFPQYPVDGYPNRIRQRLTLTLKKGKS
jgi:hypothetical protein